MCFTNEMIYFIDKTTHNWLGVASLIRQITPIKKIIQKIKVYTALLCSDLVFVRGKRNPANSSGLNFWKWVVSKTLQKLTLWWRIDQFFEVSSILLDCGFTGKPEIDELAKFTSTKTLITYSNIYCAMCHGEEISNLKTWSIHLKCDLPLNENIDIGNKTLEEISKYETDLLLWLT